MLYAKKIKEIWLSVESNNPAPTYVTKVEEISFSSLKLLLSEGPIEKVHDLVQSMYSGVAYILRGAVCPTLKNLIIELAREYDAAHPSAFYKMLDGCPNFHRIIDHEVTQNYSLYAIKHSYYFYNWNAKSMRERKFKSLVYDHWRYVKLLAGNSPKRFEHNIPSEGQIDRLQIVNYPHGGGELRDHEDPRKNQRIVSGIIMSKKGVDFEEGGFYFKDHDNNNRNIEHLLEVGDSVMFYGSIIHGVEPVDPDRVLNWHSLEGRWFVGMFVNDSDHVKGRTTARDLTYSTRFKQN